MVFPEGDEPRILQAARQFHALRLGVPMLVRAIERLSLSRDAVLYVGDMSVDIQTARAAGVHVWVVPTGSESRAALLAAQGGCAVGPDYVRPTLKIDRYLAEPLPSETRSAPIGGGSAQRFAPGKDVPAEWSPNRSRPLCVWPKYAKYRDGDVESAASFVCEAP